MEHNNRSSFQNELLKNLKSPDQIARERLEQSKTILRAKTTLYHKDIKKMLMESVSNGKYERLPEGFLVTVYYRVSIKNDNLGSPMRWYIINNSYDDKKVITYEQILNQIH